MMVTATSGSWANRLVEPEEEVVRLTAHVLNTLKLDYPVGIWKAKKVMNQYGGMTPEGPGPTLSAYSGCGTPMLWVLDGRGIIRRIVVGYERDFEQQLVR